MRILLLAAAMALAAGAAPVCAEVAPGAKPPRIPIADFATLPIMKKPILSPDGHRIAARQIADGITKILILDTDHPETVARKINLGTTDVIAVKWAGNHRLLLTIEGSQILPDGRQLQFLRLIAFNVDSGTSLLLDRNSKGMYAGDVLYTDPTGSWALVASQDFYDTYPSIKRVDLATGDAIQVEKPRERVWDWYADDQGVVRAGVAYQGRRWTVWYRDKPDEKLRVVRGKFDKDDDGAVDKFIFRGDASWILTNERTGRFGVYKYDVASGEIGAAIFEHPEVDVKDVMYNSATGEVRGIEYEDDRLRVQWLDADLKAVQAKLDHALPDAITYVIDWSDDEKRFLVWSSSGSDPGRYFLLDRTTWKMHAVVDPFPHIDPAAMAEVKPVRYQARDGLALHGYLTLPRGQSGKGLPLIVMPHGGPFERDHWEYDPIVQFLANRGYAVLQPQFRGSTGYGKDFVAKGYGEWGRKMQDDVDDGVDWLARSGQIDPRRVCIVGASYGGYAAMWGAIRNPERYRCAASLAGVSDLPALLKYDKKLFSAPRYYKEWRTQVGGEGKIDLRAVSPLSFAAQVRVPMLIGHGEKDQRVPPKQSHEMVDALNDAHAIVSSVFLKNSGHGFDSSADLQEWLGRLEEFLAQYNPA